MESFFMLSANSTSPPSSTENFSSSAPSTFDNYDDNSEPYLSSSEIILEKKFSSEFKMNLGTYLYKIYVKQKSVELYEVPWTVIAVLYFLYGVISVMSLLGNGMVVWILASSRQMRTVTNLYIGNMAVADILIGLFVVPFQFQVALLKPYYLPDFMCAFSPFFQVLSVNLSVFSLCAIALDRYRAVLNPFGVRYSKRKSILVIAIIWIVSILLAIPTYYDYKLIIIRKLFTAPCSLCLNAKLSPRRRLVYNLCLFGVQYLIPLYIISMAYSRMAVRLWGRVIPGNQEHVRDAMAQKGKIQLIKTLALVVLLFGVCWLPLQLYNIVQYIYPKLNNYPYINIIWFVIHWLAMSNSCVNPFIYAVYNDKFQEEILSRLGGCKKLCCIFVKKAVVLSTLKSTLPIAVSIAGESSMINKFKLRPNPRILEQPQDCRQKRRLRKVESRVSFGWLVSKFSNGNREKRESRRKLKFNEEENFASNANTARLMKEKRELQNISDI